MSRSTIPPIPPLRFIEVHSAGGEASPRQPDRGCRRREEAVHACGLAQRALRIVCTGTVTTIANITRPRSVLAPAPPACLGRVRQRFTGRLSSGYALARQSDGLTKRVYALTPLPSGHPRDPVLCWLGVSAQRRFRQGPPRPAVSEIASSPTSPFLTFFEMIGSRGWPGFLDITFPPASGGGALL